MGNESIGSSSSDGTSFISPTGGDPYCYNTSQTMQSVYIMVDFVLLYIAPLSLMTFVYVQISIVLWRTGRQPTATSSSTNAGRQSAGAGGLDAGGTGQYECEMLRRPSPGGTSPAVQVASICRSLSKDARRTRTARGGSLRNPSSLNVPSAASQGSCSSCETSSGMYRASGGVGGGAATRASQGRRVGDEVPDTVGGAVDHSKQHSSEYSSSTVSARSSNSHQNRNRDTRGQSN